MALRRPDSRRRRPCRPATRGGPRRGIPRRGRHRRLDVLLPDHRSDHPQARAAPPAHARAEAVSACPTPTAADGATRGAVGSVCRKRRAWGPRGRLAGHRPERERWRRRERQDRRFLARPPPDHPIDCRPRDRSGLSLARRWSPHRESRLRESRHREQGRHPGGWVPAPGRLEPQPGPAPRVRRAPRDRKRGWADPDPGRRRGRGSTDEEARSPAPGSSSWRRPRALPGPRWRCRRRRQPGGEWPAARPARAVPCRDHPERARARPAPGRGRWEPRLGGRAARPGIPRGTGGWRAPRGKRPGRGRTRASRPDQPSMHAPRRCGRRQGRPQPARWRRQVRSRPWYRARSAGATRPGRPGGGRGRLAAPRCSRSGS